jgi:hypothetical protein
VKLHTGLVSLHRLILTQEKMLRFGLMDIMTRSITTEWYEKHDCKLMRSKIGEESSETWLAWAAGLYEGEGSCSVIYNTHKKRRFHPQLNLGSTDRDVVYKFHSVVGFGNVTGPYYPKNRKLIWRWRGHGWEAVRFFLEHLGPYLGERRKARLHEILVMEQNLPEKLPTLGPRKLTVDQVCEIRSRLKVGEPQTLLGREFGVTQSTIWRIKEGLSYKDGTNCQRMV